MKKIDLRTMTKQELDKLGAEAQRVSYEDTRQLTRADRKLLARAARKGGTPRKNIRQASRSA